MYRPGQMSRQMGAEDPHRLSRIGWRRPGFEDVGRASLYLDGATIYIVHCTLDVEKVSKM